MGKGGIQPVSSLGDEAYLTGDFLHVRRGNRHLTLAVVAMERLAVALIDGLKQIATIAVTWL